MYFAQEYISRVLQIGALIVLIPGCGKQISEKKKAALSKNQAAFSCNALATNIDIGLASENSNTEVEAKLLDIPTLIGSTLIHDGHDYALNDGQLTLIWASIHDQSLITDFYLKEMERLGWQRIAVVQGSETFMLFQKPKKVCMICVRALSDKSKNAYESIIYLVVSPKEK